MLAWKWLFLCHLSWSLAEYSFGRNCGEFSVVRSNYTPGSIQNHKSCGPCLFCPQAVVGKGPGISTSQQNFFSRKFCRRTQLEWGHSSRKSSWMMKLLSEEFGVRLFTPVVTGKSSPLVPHDHSLIYLDVVSLFNSIPNDIVINSFKARWPIISQFA